MREASENGRVIARFRVTSRAEGIQIEERSMTLEICIAINNEAGVHHTRSFCRTPNVRTVDVAHQIQCRKIPLQGIFKMPQFLEESCM